MKSYIAFVKKEWIENLRTYKLLIMGVVFLLFGMMSPVLAKMTPDIIRLSGMDINMPDPTALDSWGQFFKNIGQMGLMVLVIVFSGIMASEFSKNTLVNILTKGMRRSIVVLSKFTMAVLIWTVSYLFALGVCYAYTAYFWPAGEMHHAFIAFFSMWLYGILLISLVILGGILFKSIFGSLLLTGGIVVVLIILEIIPNLQKYNPIQLSSANLTLLAGQMEVTDFVPAIIMGMVLIITSMASSMVIFNKRQL